MEKCEATNETVRKERCIFVKGKWGHMEKRGKKEGCLIPQNL